MTTVNLISSAKPSIPKKKQPLKPNMNSKKSKAPQDSNPPPHSSGNPTTPSKLLNSLDNLRLQIGLQSAHIVRMRASSTNFKIPRILANHARTSQRRIFYQPLRENSGS